MLTACAGLINLILAGGCPAAVAKSFFGGRLLALDKKSGGIRPIVIGFTLRRLASKVANSYGLARLSNSFSPRQLGVGIAGGCEAAIHATRRYLMSMEEEKVLVKIDFENAFNSLHRGDMLQAAQHNLPELYPYIYASYAASSCLFYGQDTIHSNEGPQQGDPLGPLLFCNTIHPLLESLVSELTIGYLDDLTLAGDQSSVSEDVKRIQEKGTSMGLQLNVKKCELIAHNNTVVSCPLLSSFSDWMSRIGYLGFKGGPLIPGVGA